MLFFCTCSRIYNYKLIIPKQRINPKLTASLDGFRLVLISDIHEQPALHMRVKPFKVNAKDWSGEVGRPF
jgi:hypothetical protein